MVHGRAPRPHLERGRANLAQVAIGGVEEKRAARSPAPAKRTGHGLEQGTDPFNVIATAGGLWFVLPFIVVFFMFLVVPLIYAFTPVSSLPD